MENNSEQIKQLIAIDLENARFWGSLLMPLITAFLGITLVSLDRNETLFSRFVFGALDVQLIVFATYMRKTHLVSARKYILKS